MARFNIVWSSGDAQVEQCRVRWTNHLGSGCGTVGSTVTSNTRGPRFESSHRQLLLNNYLLFVEKTKINKKGPGIAHFYNMNKSRVPSPAKMNFFHNYSF